MKRHLTNTVKNTSFTALAKRGIASKASNIVQITSLESLATLFNFHSISSDANFSLTETTADVLPIQHYPPFFSNTPFNTSLRDTITSNGFNRGDLRFPNLPVTGVDGRFLGLHTILNYLENQLAQRSASYGFKIPGWENGTNNESTPNNPTPYIDTTDLIAPLNNILSLRCNSCKTTPSSEEQKALNEIYDFTKHAKATLQQQSIIIPRGQASERTL